MANKTPVQKPLGQPIERDKSYTVAQLVNALSISKATFWRRMKSGLQEFATEINGRYEITGEQYHKWLDSLRSKNA